MIEDRIHLQPGTLWNELVARTRDALAEGVLRPIGTRQEHITDGGMRFLIRVAENLQRKAEDKARRRAEGEGKGFNPFLPPEPELTVAEVSDRHLAVLNKFNVVEHHLLLVTRHFEEQEALLTRADLAALWACMAEYEALGFYNGGRVAGASQRHKHLQMIPLPLAGDGPPTPLDPVIEAAAPEAGITTLPALPFAHRFRRLELDGASPAAAAERLRADYLAMLEALGIPPVTVDGQPHQSAPYNLLLTRRWMLVVPRSREHCGTISVNAMGFAGSLFVRDEAELQWVRETGPMHLLREVV